MAAGISNLLLVLFNFLTAFVGGGIAGFGAWLATQDTKTCLQFLHFPFLVFGCVITVISILALVAAFFQVSILMRLYLLMLFLLIVALLVFALFSFIVTHKSAAKALAGVGYKQYRLSDYSNWLQNHINDPTTWSRIQDCLRDSKMCFYAYISATQILSKVVDYLALDTYKGCCVPPDTCGYSVVNGAYVSPSNSGADTDCTTFDNNDDVRCFDCNSCPAGVLESLVTNWKKLAIGIVCIAAFLLIVYSIGCRAL